MTASRAARLCVWSLLLAVPVVFAVAGPWLAASAPQTTQAPFGPSTWSPFGTDRLGRDVLAAALVGGPSLVGVTVCTVVVTYVIGFAIGVGAAATRHPLVEDLLMRPIDVLLCLPSILIVLVAAVRSNGSAVAVAVAAGFATLAPIVRFVRMAARGVVQGPLMDALVMQGAGWWHRYGRVALRLMARPVAADVGVRIAATAYIVAAANFLGLGFDSTSPDWAVAVAANKDALLVWPPAVLLPAGLVVSFVLGVNLLVDELLTDPRTAQVRRAVRQARRAATTDGGGVRA